MKKTPVLGIVIAAIVYLILFVLGATTGLIHPACFAYVGTFLPLLFAFVYYYVAANLRCFGAAALLNVFVLIAALLAGEGNLPLIIGLLLLAVIAELIRMLCGYDTRRGVRRSFIPLAFSFYAYTAHWWTDPEGTLAAAAEEMSPAYAEKVRPIVENVPMLILMLALTVPVAILAIRLAEKALKKQAAKLK